MSSTLVSALHTEERSIIAELRASKPFQRLEGIHKLLTLYDAQPSVAVSIGAGAPDAERSTAPVIQLAPPLPTGVPIPMPAPASTDATIGDSSRQHAYANGSMPHDDQSGVVSSVRAALLGIGKG